MTKRQLITGLAILNVGLLGALAWRAIPQSMARAQPDSTRQRGDYLMVTSEIVSSPVGLVVVLDQQNREMTALASDQGRIVSQAVIKLDPIFEGAPGDHTPGNNTPRNPRIPPKPTH